MVRGVHAARQGSIGAIFRCMNDRVRAMINECTDSHCLKAVGQTIRNARIWEYNPRTRLCVLNPLKGNAPC